MEAELQQQLEDLRRNPKRWSGVLRSNRSNNYKGSELMIVNKGTMESTLFATNHGRRGCLSAITALEKSGPLPPFRFSNGLGKVARDSVHSVVEGKPMPDLMQGLTAVGTFSSTRKQEFKAERIVLSGHEFANGAEDIMMNALINDGDATWRARKALLDAEYTHVGVAVANHPETGENGAVVLVIVSEVWADK